jgi:hypothetical protein
MTTERKLHGYYTDKVYTPADMEKAIVAEREACAKVCDDKHDTWRWDDEADSASGPRDCAASIRARGEQA